jgi:hypothetical protein
MILVEPAGNGRFIINVTAEDADLVYVSEKGRSSISGQ